MKKIRKIKILVTTKEILIAHSAAPDSVDGFNNLPICPVCASPLAGTLTTQTDASNSAAVLTDGNERRPNEGNNY